MLASSGLRFQHFQKLPLPINKAPFAPCRTAVKRFSLALDDIKKLIDVGKEKGSLAYNEVNDLIPHDVHSSEDLDDLLTTVSTQGIDVLEGPPGYPPRPSKTGLKRKWRPARTITSSTCPEAFLKRQSIRRASTCARWARCLCSPAKGKLTLPSASSAESQFAVADYESERG